MLDSIAAGNWNANDWTGLKKVTSKPVVIQLSQQRVFISATLKGARNESLVPRSHSSRFADEPTVLGSGELFSLEQFQLLQKGKLA